MQNELSATLPPNPFNPGAPVDPRDFVGRVQELESFQQKLKQTASGSLASMAVAGGYGVGKTSFLHKCRTLAQEQNALTIYFSLNEVDKLNKEALANTLVQRIQEKVQEEVVLKRLSSSVLAFLQRIKVKVGEVEVGLGKEDSLSSPTLQRALAGAWEALKKDKTAIVFLIDEARVLEKNQAELILYLRAVLEQLQIEHIPVMIVPAGKLTITGPSGTGFSPLVRTFPPVILENFTVVESQTFIEKKLTVAGISIKKNLFEKIYQVTEGHPYVLTAYLAGAYTKLQKEERELVENHFLAADLEFASHTLALFFSRFYDHAGKTSKKILLQMAQNPKSESSLSELSALLKKGNNELSPHLAKLVQDGAVIRVERGRYRLFHHLLGSYILTKKEE